MKVIGSQSGTLSESLKRVLSPQEEEGEEDKDYQDEILEDQSVKAFRKRELKLRSIDRMLHLYLKKIAKLLGIRWNIIVKWAQNGLIKLDKKIADNGKVIRKIKINDLYNFCSQYMFTENVAKVLRIDESTVTKWIDYGIINAYSGLKIDGTRSIPI